MQRNAIKRPRSLSTARRVGRGGRRGKTSGRGMKGAGARAGNKSRPEMRDIIKKIPKRRGYGKNRARTVVPGRTARAVSLAALNAHFADGDTVTPRELVIRGLVRRVSGKPPRVKVLASGTLAKKLTFSNIEISAPARAAIEGAGGTIG